MILFRGDSHKIKFSEAIKKYQKPPDAHGNRRLAAVYLLTADNKLWARARSNIREGRMEFEAVDVNGISLDAYTFMEAARCIYKNDENLSLYDLADPYIIGEKTFRIIMQAVHIARCGMEAKMNKSFLYIFLLVHRTRMCSFIYRITIRRNFWL